MEWSVHHQPLQQDQTTVRPSTPAKIPTEGQKEPLVPGKRLTQCFPGIPMDL
uniref:Alternative protein MARVELD2 n=1 Tax=Homo sapiens TaxID=9606 RepID=L8EAP3_HUMAN|nr:alternative protein MARVELD2 [Homo sapiens]